MKRINKLEIRSRRVPCTAEDTVIYSAPSITAPYHAANVAHGLLGCEAQEVFIALFLNSKNKIIGYTEVGRGGLDQCQVDPRVVFRAALLASATAIIVAHNHPSGDTAPSVEDTALTSRLVRAGQLLGCPILDHLIVCEEIGNYYSYLSESPTTLK